MIDAVPEEITTPRGRPRDVALSPEAALALAQQIAVSNSGRDAVSATTGAWGFARESCPELLDVLAARSSKHDLPVAVREVAQRVRGIIPAARDTRRVRDYGVVTGGMRLHPDGRRLLSGEVMSIDDVTANTACCVPWPQGGDRCSDRYGVRVGRWQTLIDHCEGSSFVPIYVSAVRWEQTYRGEDAAVVVGGLARTVCRPDRLRLEGGVWQGGRVLAALDAMGITLESVKARPNQKLVENWINPFHTEMARIMRGRAQMGRFRGEEKAWSEVYVACRRGDKDPRLHFPMVADLLDATDRAIIIRNETRRESRTYGKWIPRDRWETDLAAHPRPPVTEAEVPEWTTAPVLVVRTATRGQVVASAVSPDGESLRHTFCAPELTEWRGRQVRVAFDPFCLDAGATIIEAKRPRVICQASFTGAGAGRAATDAVKALRDSVRRELRVLLPNQPTRREILVRVPTSSTPSVSSVESVPSSPRRATKLPPAPARDWAAEAAENEAALSRRGALVIPCAIT